MVTKLIMAAVLAIPMLYSSSLHAAASIFNSDIAHDVAEVFWDGDANKTLNAIQLSLKQEPANFYAVAALIFVHLNHQDFQEFIRTLGDSPADHTIARSAQIIYLYNQSRYLEAVESYRGAAPDEISPWAIDQAALAAGALGDQEEEAKFLVDGIKRFPNFFLLAWELAEPSLIHYPVVAAALQSGEIPKGSPAAEFLSKYIAAPTWTQADRVAVGRAWLSREPGDIYAARMIVRALNDLQRYDEAAPLATSALKAFPFKPDHSAMAIALIRTGRSAEAQSIVAKLEAGFASKQSDSKTNAARLWAVDLMEEGDYGAARTVLTGSLAAAPENHGLVSQMARLELADGRGSQGVALAQKAMSLQTDPRKGYDLLIEALSEDGQADETVATFDAAQKAGWTPSPESFQKVSDALSKSSDDRQVAILTAAVKLYPKSQYMAREYADALWNHGNQDGALVAIKATIDADPSNNWAIIRYAKWYETSKGRTGSNAALAELSAKYPWQEQIWAEIANRQKGVEAELSVWRQAASLNPDWAIPLQHQIEMFVRAKRWAEGVTAAQAARRSKNLMDRPEVIFLEPLVVSKWSAEEPLAKGKIADAEAVLEEYKAAGGQMVRYHDTRAELLLAVGEHDPAAESALQAARLSPAINRFHKLVAVYAGSLGGRAWKYGAFCLARNPMSSSTVEEYVHKHVLWNGSPVVALRAIADARKRGVPDSAGLKNLEGRAYGFLGDAIKAFRASYLDCGCAPATSDRYIDWYDAVRKNIVKDKIQVRVIENAPLPTVEIIGENGVITRRTDDQETGGILSLTSGRAYIRSTYNPEGQLKRIEDSGGSWLELTYSGAKIATLQDNRGKKVKVEYDHQLPSKITVEGMGTLRVTRVDGAIKSVDAEPENKNIDKSSVAIQISSVFSSMLTLAEQLERNSGEQPELPFSDPAIDKLRLAYEVADESKKHGLDAGLKLARYEVDHLKDSSRYASEADLLLRKLIDRATTIDASQARRPATVSTVALWRRLMRETRPYGLRSTEYSLWYDYQHLIAQAADAGNPDARKLRAEAGDYPQLLDAPWYTKHAIANPGYWTRWAVDGTMPAEVRDAERRAMLLRRNGDVVLGTSKGIAVFRRGFWQWFGFDPSRGSLTSNVARSALDARSSVLSLAEAGDGHLWIGTERGLFEIDGDYASVVHSWQATSKELPSIRITAMASGHGNVWIGTEAGLAVYDGQTIASASSNLAGRTIRFIKTANSGPARADIALPPEVSTLLEHLDPETKHKVAQMMRNVDEDHLTSSELHDLEQVLSIKEPLASEVMAAQRAALARTLNENVQKWAALDKAYPEADLDAIGRQLESAEIRLTPGEVQRLKEFEDNSPDNTKYYAEIVKSVSGDGKVPISEARARLVNHLNDLLGANREVRQRKIWLRTAFLAHDSGLSEREKMDYVGEIDSLDGSDLPDTLTRISTRLTEPAAVSNERNAKREAALAALRDRLSGDSVLIVGTDIGVISLAGGKWAAAVDHVVDDALFDPDEDRLIILSQGHLTTKKLLPNGRAGGEIPVEHQSQLRYQKEIYGIVSLTIEGVGSVPTVLTDEGLAFYHGQTLQFMELPLRHERHGLMLGPRLASAQSNSAWFLTEEGAYSFDADRAIIAGRSRVYDLVSNDQLGVTYAALGNEIGYVDHEDPGAGLQHFSAASAVTLAFDGKTGDLIANDGDTIVRYRNGLGSGEELFKISQRMPEGFGQGHVKNIIISKDGSIWVAAGPGVFHWDNGQLEHYNWFDDPVKFPARSEKISRVIETISGEILVVASDESHLNYNGISLSGGILRKNGDHFEQIERSQFGGYWFLTGYTPINDQLAIVGSNYGFSRFRNGQYQSFAGLKDPSYKRLLDSTKQLWLGGNGTKLNEDSWLFPSGAGVLLWHKNTWSYPTRLNELLPDDALVGQYGGRTVHAVASDSNGTVYAGTDNGLLVYRAGGGVASLLIDNGQSDTAFNDENLQQLNEQREVLVHALDHSSQAGRLVDALEAIERSIAILSGNPSVGLLRNDDYRANEVKPEGQSALPSQGATPSQDQKRDALREQLRQRAEVLAKLESENFGLFQMMTADPRELGAIHDRLSTDDAVVQYIIDSHKMHIQVVTHDGPLLFDVDVDYKDLDVRIRSVVTVLSERAMYAGSPDSISTKLSQSLQKILGSSGRSLDTDLAWLYEALIRPIGPVLSDKKHIYIVPTGHLYYLPFAALRDAKSPGSPFFVQQHTIGVLPSLFTLDLALRHRPSLQDVSFVMGDPDNSLPGAREEAQEVARVLGQHSTMEIGSAATLDSFVQHAPGSRIIHLATHGVLDRNHPAESYLVMAGGKRLDMVDVQTIDLKTTDIVVLSACETGLGRDGLEIATMARAFAHANVPTVIATLWSISDEPTKSLMKRFYTRYTGFPDAFEALAGAQRDLIAGGGALAAPEAWAGVEIFGKP